MAKVAYFIPNAPPISTRRETKKTVYSATATGAPVCARGAVSIAVSEVTDCNQSRLEAAS